jgi:citrate lyase subunit beta / citryl-CoA lyase
VLITRSLLSTPGNQARMLERASGCGADALMFDLEDSVPIAQKETARRLVREQLDSIGSANVVYVRVNSWESGVLVRDIEAVLTASLHGIVVPKVESPESIKEIDDKLGQLERREGVPVGQIELAPALESARAIWLVYELLAASPRCRTVLVGTAEGGDLQADLRSSWSVAGPELMYVRSRVITAARALGIDNILDGAYSNVKDETGLIADSKLSRSLGYRGRMLIHPNQVAVVNRIFTATDEEIARSKRIIAAFEQAAATDRGAISVDGVMVDVAMAKRARAILDEVEVAE